MGIWRHQALNNNFKGVNIQVAKDIPTLFRKVFARSCHFVIYPRLEQDLKEEQKRCQSSSWVSIEEPERRTSEVEKDESSALQIGIEDSNTQERKKLSKQKPRQETRTWLLPGGPWGLAPISLPSWYLVKLISIHSSELLRSDKKLFSFDATINSSMHIGFILMGSLKTIGCMQSHYILMIFYSYMNWSQGGPLILYWASLPKEIRNWKFNRRAWLMFCVFGSHVLFLYTPFQLLGKV